MSALLRILALIRKELLAILKDPRSRAILLLPPFIESLIFGYAATYDLTDVPYAVVNRDGGQASRQLLARLDSTGIFHRLANLDRPAEVDQWINSRRVVLVIRIDSDFQRRLSSGGSANVQLISDGRNSNTAAVATGYVLQVVDSFNADWRAQHAQAPPAVAIADRAWFNPNLESRWNMIPALIGTLTMLGTMILTALSVAREREQGTFDQLLVTPLVPAEIMIGKAVPCMLVGLVQATTVLLVAQLWFHIPFAGSFLTLYLGLGLFLLASVGLGLVVSSIAATMQQAMLYCFMLVMPFILLSGLTTPIQSMPRSLQAATLLNPLRYAIELSHRVYLEGAGFERLGSDLWPLAVMGILALSAASWLFRRRLY